jgi:orotidine 5'-phosphate decarboxylase subfamily 2
MTSLLQKFSILLKEKDSILCVGLDPALPRQRVRDVIPSEYLTTTDENEARLNFCLDIVEQVKEYSIAAKPNQQYVLGFTKQQHRKLTDAIRRSRMLSILDYKLNDIRDTVESSLFHLAECGYDAITFNPLMGNLEEAVKLAHESVNRTRGHELGIIVLTLTSNPEAVRYMKQATLGGQPLYVSIAQDIRKHKADGAVVGATGHVTQEDVRLIRETIGEDKVILFPGVGAQEGDPEKIIKAGNQNILINVGRDIIYSDNPAERAKSYRTLFKQTREAHKFRY